MQAFLKKFEPLLITLGLALLVIVFTKGERQILIFVGLFVALEVVYLLIKTIIDRHKNH